MNSAMSFAGAPLLKSADVVVVGAGSAGCSAALSAAAFPNCSVILVERYGFLGGISTQSLDTFYGFFTPGAKPKKVVGGIPDRVVTRLHETGDMFLRANTYGAGTGVNYNPERLKVVWDRLLTEAGVTVLLHTTLVDVLTTSNGRIDSVVAHGPRGFFRLGGKRFVDATGNAELCALAGCESETAGELEPAQTLTTTFRMANVDLEVFQRSGGKTMLQQKMKEAVDSGRFLLPRKSGSIHAMVQPGCISTVAVRVADTDPFDVMSLTRGEMEGRRQVFVYEDFLRAMVPGFEGAKVIGMSSPQIGIRESRRVYGEYRLTREDCLGVRKFSDTVLLCGAPIEDHRKSADGGEETEWVYIPNGGVYGVPYGTLVPRGRDDLWVAGRCFSATHGAHASCRSMGQTMSMGQAAGAAAALSLASESGARTLDVGRLQAHLRRMGAVLDAPDVLAHVGHNDWPLNR